MVLYFQVRHAILIEFPRQCEAWEEHIPHQDVYQELPQWVADVVVHDDVVGELTRWIQPIKKLTAGASLAALRRYTLWPTLLPEEGIFPRGQVLGFVDIRQQAREDAYAIQHLRSNVLMRVRRYLAGLQSLQARYAGVYQRLEVLPRWYLVAGGWAVGGIVQGQVADVVGGPECEDVFSALGELVELQTRGQSAYTGRLSRVVIASRLAAAAAATATTLFTISRDPSLKRVLH